MCVYKKCLMKLFIINLYTVCSVLLCIFLLWCFVFFCVVFYHCDKLKVGVNGFLCGSIPRNSVQSFLFQVECNIILIY